MDRGTNIWVWGDRERARGHINTDLRAQRQLHSPLPLYFLTSPFALLSNPGPSFEERNLSDAGAFLISLSVFHCSEYIMTALYNQHVLSFDCELSTDDCGGELGVVHPVTFEEPKHRLWVKLRGSSFLLLYWLLSSLAPLSAHVASGHFGCVVCMSFPFLHVQLFFSTTPGSITLRWRLRPSSTAFAPTLRPGSISARSSTRVRFVRQMRSERERGDDGDDVDDDGNGNVWVGGQ